MPRTNPAKKKAAREGGFPSGHSSSLILLSHPEGEGVGPAPPIYPGGAGGLMKPERRKEPGQ